MILAMLKEVTAMRAPAVRTGASPGRNRFTPFDLDLGQALPQPPRRGDLVLNGLLTEHSSVRRPGGLATDDECLNGGQQLSHGAGAVAETGLHLRAQLAEGAVIFDDFKQWIV